MRLKELRGLPVIDPTAARKVGFVTDFQVDPATGQVAALDIDASDNRGPERVLAQRVRRVGSSAVVLTARGGSAPGIPADLNPDWLDSATLTGLEVMGDDGNRIGKLVDATFNQDTLGIDSYLLETTPFARLFGRRARIAPDTVHACSRELMIVATGQTAEAPAPSAAAEREPAQPSTVTVRMPLKDEDRLPAPSFETAADGQTVGTRGR